VIRWHYSIITVIAISAVCMGAVLRGQMDVIKEKAATAAVNNYIEMMRYVNMPLKSLSNVEVKDANV